MQLNRDDYRWVVGMNRLRHGYLKLRPELEANFISSPYDDLPGALRTLGVDVTRSSGAGSMLHIFQTLPGMLSVIVAAVAGAMGALAGVAVGFPALGVVVAAAVTFGVAAVLMGLWGRRSFRNSDPSLEPRFPSPKT